MLRVWFVLLFVALTTETQASTHNPASVFRGDTIIFVVGVVYFLFVSRASARLRSGKPQGKVSILTPNLGAKTGNAYELRSIVGSAGVWKAPMDGIDSNAKSGN